MPPRALTTRRRPEPLGRLLRARGIEPVHVPLIELVSTHEPPPPTRPDLVLVTSPAVVEFAGRLHEAIAGAQVVSVGVKSSATLRRVGIEPVAEGASGAQQAVAHLAELAAPRSVVWHIGAEVISPDLEQALASWGHAVVRWRVYRNRAPADLAEALSLALPVDAILFAAGSAARNFAAHATAGDARVVAIGRPTAEACHDVGLPVHAIASTPSMEAMVDSVVALLPVEG